MLRKAKLLDGHFRSVYHKRLPAMRNAKLAIVSKKTNEYNMICRPSIWKENQGNLPSTLYGMVFVFIPLQPLSRDYRSIVLLSRVQLPAIPSFPIYLENDRETTIQSIVFDQAISVGAADLAQLSNFTFAAFRDVFHKTFEVTPGKFPYWLAPIKQGALIEKTAISPRDTIDWDVLREFNENEELRWNKSMDPASLLDRFLYDGWDGKKRFFPLSVDPSFQASDRPPQGVPKRKWMDTILGYSLSLSKNSRVKFFEDADWEQPVFHAECVCLRRNFLDRATEKERAEVTQCVICPQPLNISLVCCIWKF